jgi:hypothetical protein
MLRFICFFIVFPLLHVYAQKPAENCSLRMFKQTNAISAKECWDEDKRFGFFEAFDGHGNSIGKWNLSRMHQYSSVQVSYHPNGAVAKVRYSSHPDGGIQWFRSETGFDSTGKQIAFWEDSHDRTSTLVVPAPQPPKPGGPPVQEIVEEAPLKVSELWLVNTTPDSLHLSVKGAGRNFEVHLAPGAWRKLLDWPMPGHFADPKPNIRFKTLSGRGEISKQAWIQEEGGRKRYLYTWHIP